MPWRAPSAADRAVLDSKDFEEAVSDDDGSGRPAFYGDVGVAQGKVVELGRLGGSARRVIEADGRVVSPGFVDKATAGCAWRGPTRRARAFALP